MIIRRLFRRRLTFRHSLTNNDDDAQCCYDPSKTSLDLPTPRSTCTKPSSSFRILRILLIVCLLIEGRDTLKISPKPCSNALGEEGTCMFVWECIKTDGKHLGTCVDGFLFGSCCGHNDTSNEIVGGSTGTNNQWVSSHQPSSSSTSSFPDYPSSSNGGTSSTWPDYGSPSTSVHQQKPTTSLWTTERPISSPFDNFFDPLITNPLDDEVTVIVTASGTSSTSTTTTPPPPVTIPQSSPSSLPSSPSLPQSPTSVGVWKPWHQVSSPVQSPPSSVSAINVIGPSRWPTTSTTPSTPIITTPSSILTTTLLNPFRPPIFSIFGTHRPPTLIMKPPGRPTRPPIMRPPIFPNRPTVSIFQPFSRPTPVPVFPTNHQHPSPTTPSTTTSSPPMAGHFPASPPHHPSNPSSGSPFPGPGGNPSTGSSATTTEYPGVMTASASAPNATVNRRPTVPINGKVECGMSPLLPQTKVVGGKNAAFGSWPWQVSVRRTSFFGFSSTHRCGGAVINQQWIATAGHCVDDLLLSQIRIRVGEYDFASAMEPFAYVERGAKKKVVHPHYNFFTYENDLALVQLEEPLDYQPHIGPICLPPDNIELIGRNATVTGWGRLSEGGILPSVLQEVRVPIVSNDKCKGMFLSAGRHEYIPEIFMCAGYPEGGRDSCQGDSGGPLQVQGDDGRWFLAGIISWGIGCAEPNLPGVCTRISKFKNWIVTTVNNN